MMHHAHRLYETEYTISPGKKHEILNIYRMTIGKLLKLNSYFILNFDLITISVFKCIFCIVLYNFTNLLCL